MKRLVAPLVGLVALFGLGGNAFAATSVNTSATPGATDSTATQQSVCASGYAPSSKVTSATKRRVFAAYHVKTKQQNKYVINHLVPLSIGGTNDPTNLWPQLRSQAKKKESQEVSVRALVCANLVDLAAAQESFQSDWHTAQQTAQTAADARKSAVAQYVEAQKQAQQAAIAQFVAAQEQAKQAAAQAAAEAAAQAAAEQQAQQQQASCPNGTYVNSVGNTVCSPYQSPSGPPAGATAQCRDGSYSFSQSRSGTCSSHGGVAQWL